MNSPTPAPQIGHPAGEVLVEARHLSVTYPGGASALRRSTLAVAQGEFLVLLGASGAGKSTLLRCLNGLVTPTEGEVRVHDLPGQRLTRALWRAHRRGCGMVFQQHHLIGRLSVLDNVLMGRLAHASSLRTLWPWGRDDKRLALAVIDRVGLLDKALARADTLSGGQQQRVGIARALVQSPRLLLADEPVASLDPATADDVMRLLHDICKTDRLTAVVSLHQVHLARRHADRIVGLRAGEIVFEGTPEGLTAEVEADLYGGRRVAKAATLAARPTPATPPTPDIARAA